MNKGIPQNWVVVLSGKVEVKIPFEDAPTMQDAEEIVSNWQWYAEHTHIAGQLVEILDFEVDLIESEETYTESEDAN